MSERPIGFWLKLVDGLIDEQFAATLDEHGVTRRQWQLLNVLTVESAGLEQLDAAVAPFLNDHEETSAEHLEELVDSGWVGLSADIYALTELGRTSFERLSAVVVRNRQVIAEGIRDDEYLATVGVLERMARNLGWHD